MTTWTPFRAAGQLGTVLANVAVLPNARTTKIRYMAVFNVGVSTEDVEVYHSDGTTNRLIAACTLLTGEWAEVYDGSVELDLPLTDALKALTTNATSVNYLILGESTS